MEESKHVMNPRNFNARKNFESDGIQPLYK